MATMPAEEEVKQTTVERVREAVTTTPGRPVQRQQAALAVAAGCACLAPLPFNVVAVMSILYVASLRR